MSSGIGTNLPVWDLLSTGSDLFAGTDGLGVFRSVNNGGSWTAVNSGLTNLNISSFGKLGTYLFTGTLEGVFRSENSGGSWIHVSSGLTEEKVFALLVNGTDLFAGTWGGGVFRSNNNGNSWSFCGIPNSNIYSLIASGTNIFAGTIGSGIYLSTNNGSSWNPVNSGLPPTTIVISDIALCGTIVYLGTWGNGVFRSTNNGSTWQSTALTSDTIMTLISSGNNLIAGTRSGIVVSSNNGASWIVKDQGFNAAPNVLALRVVNNYMFAGTEEHKVWRRSLSEVFAVKNISTEVPDAFTLSQNYPNPFNPKTIITFELPKTELVSLTVYDELGREIETLVNEQLHAGTYEVDWNASNYPSGVYFYTMRTEGYTETKRMILIK